jgi:hypothetical protein
MDRQYDIFEKFPSGTLAWRAVKVGHEQSVLKMKELAACSTNEFVLMHVPTHSVIAIANAKKAS